jgi:general transcription factor 3C polypeptide 5 (transcription factor C subunit 1)
MTSPDNIHHAGEGLAPKLQIPSRAVSVVEHPCIVKNVDKGVVSLGGEVKLSKVCLALVRLQQKH